MHLQFLSAVMLKDYKKALKYCKLSKFDLNIIKRWNAYKLKLIINSQTFANNNYQYTCHNCHRTIQQFYNTNQTTLQPKNFTRL